MAYSTNPNLPKARAIALRMLLLDRQPLQVVTNRCGVHRSTIWRWTQKWREINKYRQMDNPNRPNRAYSRANHLARCSWRIPTPQSIPKTSPHAIAETVVARVLELRYTLKRCAEVIWYHLTQIGDDQGVLSISLSTVRRILRRHHCFDGARKKRVRPDNPRRPLVTRAGELIQTDTIHYICPHTKRRRYVYTVINLYTRMAYAEVHSRILPGKATQIMLNAQQQFGFQFTMVQADNGPEFGGYLSRVMNQHGIAVRHSRLGRSNDNAHIERFNRTVQEECLGSRLTYRTSNQQVQAKLTLYLDYYNTKRVHLGLQLKTPAQMLQRS